jgi:hypothetical protein
VWYKDDGKTIGVNEALSRQFNIGASRVYTFKIIHNTKFDFDYALDNGTDEDIFAKADANFTVPLGVVKKPDVWCKFECWWYVLCREFEDVEEAKVEAGGDVNMAAETPEEVKMGKKYELVHEMAAAIPFWNNLPVSTVPNIVKTN